MPARSARLWARSSYLQMRFSPTKRNPYAAMSCCGLMVVTRDMTPRFLCDGVYDDRKCFFSTPSCDRATIHFGHGAAKSSAGGGHLEFPRSEARCHGLQ